MTVLSILVAVSWVGWDPAAAADLGSLSIKGSVRAEIALATSDNGNPQNVHRFDDHDRDLQLFALRTEVDFIWRYSDNLSAFAKVRGWGDVVNKVDDAFRKRTDLFAGTDYPGNGALVEGAGSNTIFDLPHAYVDINRGPWWIRVGKQQIAWGESIFFRSLDAVNSLDLRRHHVFDVLSEEYADERISQWGIRGSLRIPYTKFEIEAFVTDFTPTLLAPPGSPYASLPVQVSVEDAREIADARHRPIYGGRIRGELIDGLEIQLNFVSRPQQVGVFRYAQGSVVLEGRVTPFHADGELGFRSVAELSETLERNRFSVGANVATLLGEWQVPPFVFANLEGILNDSPLRGVVTREFPRVELLGGGFNYLFQFAPDSPLRFLDSVIFRGEAMYTFNKKFTTAGLSRDFLNRDELNTALVVEKWHKFHPSLPATFIVLEWWRKSRSDFLERLKRQEGGRRFDVFGVAIQQQLFQNRVRVDMVTAYDLDAGVWFQPGVRWKPREKFQVDLYYNYFSGSGDDLFGSFESLDEVFTRLTYYF